MRQRTRGRLVAAIFAAGLVGGWRWVTHPRWHNPRFRRRLRRRSIRPRPLCRRPHPIRSRRHRRRLIRSRSAAGGSARDPSAAPPTRSRRRGRPVRPQPQPIPEGTPAGQNPTPFVGQPVFAPPTFNPTNGSMVGAAKPIYINFAAPDRRPRDGRAGHPHLVGPAGARPVLLDQRHPGALAAAGLLAGRDRRQHRRRGTKSSFTVPEQLVATIDDKAHQMEIVRNGKLEKTFPVSMGKPRRHDTRTAPTTCWRSSPTS